MEIVWLNNVVSTGPGVAGDRQQTDIKTILRAHMLLARYVNDDVLV